MKKKKERFTFQGNHWLPGGYPVATRKVASGCPGSGSGSGSGAGDGFAGRNLRLTRTDDEVLADTFPQPSGKERIGLYRKMDVWLHGNPSRMPIVELGY